MVLIRKIDTERMISRGAPVKNDRKAEWTSVCLLITRDLLEEVDRIKDPDTSRNAWIRQAIKEKARTCQE